MKKAAKNGAAIVKAIVGSQKGAGTKPKPKAVAKAPNVKGQPKTQTGNPKYPLVEQVLGNSPAKGVKATNSNAKTQSQPQQFTPEPGQKPVKRGTGGVGSYTTSVPVSLAQLKNGGTVSTKEKVSFKRPKKNV